jgi:hypothetical protein
MATGQTTKYIRLTILNIFTFQTQRW